MCVVFAGGQLSRRLRWCVLTLRRCFLSTAACWCKATVAHRRNRIFPIHRGVATRKHHSVPGERMLDSAGKASLLGRGWCCLPQEVAHLLVGTFPCLLCHSRNCPDPRQCYAKPGNSPGTAQLLLLPSVLLWCLFNT